MAVGFDIPLTNSRGLSRVVHFAGLDVPMVVAPSLLGEPIISAQAVYFLERTDCVARLRFESQDSLTDHSSHQELEAYLEYLVDNYLFEFTAKHPDWPITAKVHDYPFWRNDPDNHYFAYDWNQVEYLVLDTLNDSSILACSDDTFRDKEFWSDWNLFRNYFEEIHSDYRQKLMATAGTVVRVETDGHSSLGAGAHQLPILRFRGRPLSLDQMQMLEVITPGEFDGDSDWQLISRGFHGSADFRLPKEHFVVTKRYDQQLLAYYFCAVRDPSPLAQFRNFYNVLEYFFEYYPSLLGVRARTELEQLSLLVTQHTSVEEYRHIVGLFGPEWRDRVTANRRTSSGEPIAGLDLDGDDLLNAYSRRLYTIRCACVHSKMTRRGAREPRLVPSTNDEAVLADEINLLRWLAIKCIRAAGEVGTSAEA